MIDRKNSQKEFFVNTIKIIAIFSLFGALWLNFTYSNTNMYITKPTLFLTHNKINITEWNKYKIPQNRINEIKHLLDISTKFKKGQYDLVVNPNKSDTILGYNNSHVEKDGFWIKLDKDFIENTDHEKTFKITQEPANLNCSINDETLECNYPESFNGLDNLYIELTDKLMRLKSSAKFNINIQNRQDLPTFTQTNVNKTFKQGQTLKINLTDYIDNTRSLDYTLTIQKNLTKGWCSLNDSVVSCSFNTYFTGTDSATFLIEESNSTITFNFTKENTPPILDQSKLVNGQIPLEIKQTQTKEINLKDYTTDPDPTQNYTYSLITNPTIAQCSINGDVLSCKGTKVGEETIVVQLTDEGDTLDLPIRTKVVEYNAPPVYLENFDENGITVFDTNPQFSIDLSKYFNDPDTQNLQFGFDKVNPELPNSADLFCDPTETGLSCTVTGNSTYADIKFWADDGTTKTNITKKYRVAIVSKKDFLAIIVGPQKVVNAQPFDMEYKIQNNLVFDVYNLPISYDKSENPDLNVKFYGDDGGLLSNNYIYADITPLGKITKKIQITTPDEKTPHDYNIAPKLDNANIYSNTQIKSIPFTAYYLKDYLEIESYVPGDAVSGFPNRLPGFIFGVPYKVYNYLDVPIKLYECYYIETFSGNEGKLFKKENNTYILINGNEFCQLATLNKNHNVTAYVQNTGNSNLIVDYYLELSPESQTIAEKPKFFKPIPKYFTSYAYANISEPSYGSTLNKNTEYDVNVNFTNGYAYEIVNMPVGIQAAKWVTSGEYSNETDYYKIISNSKYIDLNYNLGDYGTNQNSTKTETFKFKTKDKSYDWDDLASDYISAGYFLDENYFSKSSKAFKIN